MFITEDVQPGDRVYLVSGGLSHFVAQTLIDKGVEVGIIQASKLPTRSKRLTLKTLKRIIEEHPEVINLWYPYEREAFKVRNLLREWERLLETRKALSNRLINEYYAQFLASPKKHFRKTPAEAKKSAQRYRDANPNYQAISKAEQKVKRLLIETVKELDLYQEVFEPLDGCGPLIAARIIAYTRNIRRFKSKWAYAKYCGFGLIEKNGKRRKQYRRKGETTDRHTKLYYTIRYLWIEQQLRQFKRGNLAQILIDRIRYEMEKGNDRPGTATGRAIWWLGKNICFTIYSRWRKYEGLY